MAAEDDNGKPRMTFERFVTIGSILIAIGSMIATINNHDSRISNLETRDTMTRELMAEMRGDVKVLLERTDPKRHQ